MPKSVFNICEIGKRRGPQINLRSPHQQSVQNYNAKRIRKLLHPWQKSGITKSVGPENVPHYNLIVGSLQVQYSLIIALV